MGFHFHIGSQLLNPENHLEGIDVLIELMKKSKRSIWFYNQRIKYRGGRLWNLLYRRRGKKAS